MAAPSGELRSDGGYRFHVHIHATEATHLMHSRRNRQPFHQEHTDFCSRRLNAHDVDLPARSVREVVEQMRWSR